MAAKVIGVISDTHGLLRPEAVAALRGSDLLLHAGDIGAEEILRALGEIAPVVSVRGNNDRQSWARPLPETADVELLGIRIHVLHDLSQLSLEPEREGVRVVVCGHSHKPCNELRNGVLYFNPGSAGPRRFKLPVALGFLQLENGSVRGRILELGQRPQTTSPA
jgi:putative phosphoesterase